MLDKLRALRISCRLLATGAFLWLLEVIRMGRTRKRKRQLGNEQLDGIPLVSEESSRSSISARFCANKEIRYHCAGSGIRLITLRLPAFRREQRVITAGEDICIAPFVVHAFLAQSDDMKSSDITRKDSNSWNYSFDIDMECEYTEMPDDFEFDVQKMRVAERMLRRIAFQNPDQGLTYVGYALMLIAVREIGRMFDLSDFEQSVVYSMAFDWIQRLHNGKEPVAQIAFGAYRRVHGASGSGYHDVRATEISPRAGFPFIELEHITHLANQREIPLPRVTIGKNVVIEGRIEISLGLSIGEFSWIAPGASFLKHEHKPGGGGQLTRTVDNTISYPTEIGPYVMIGQKAKVLPHTFYIGKGAVIGHSAVVARSVGDYAIVVGNPARVIRYNVELAERLEQENEHEYSERTRECPIPYESLLERTPSRRDVVIVGARETGTIISAARFFERVLAVVCCVDRVVPLLKGLVSSKLKNVCLQSGTTSLIYELEHRRSFSLIWLSEDETPELSEPNLLKSIQRNSSIVLTRKDGKLSALLMESQELRPDAELSSEGYSTHVRTER